MIKRIIPVLLAWGLLLALPLKAAAHELPQERNDCSIEVQVRFDGEEVTGGTITAVRVGYVDEEYGSCFF